MVGRGKEGRGRQIDQVVIGIQLKRNIVRNPKNSVPAANHGLLVPAISKPKPGRELLFIQRYVVPGVVRRRPNQRCVTDAGRPRSTVATCDCGVDQGRIKVAQTIVAVGPWSLKFVAEPHVQSQLLGHVPGVTSVKRAVGLTARGLRWNFSRTFCLVHERSRPKLRQTQQEISEGKAAVCSGSKRIVCGPGSGETERAAGNVGLVIIVQPQFILPAKLKSVFAVNDSQRWRHVVLGVVIANHAVALALAYVTREREGRRWRSAHNFRNRAVVTRGPSELSEIVPGEKRRTNVNEAASRNIQIADNVRAEHMVEIDGESLGVIILSAS